MWTEIKGWLGESWVQGALALIALIPAFGVWRRRSGGGKGGDASVGGDGTAIGGAGGISQGRFGPGGDGGNAAVTGNGRAVAGKGGNGGSK